MSKNKESLIVLLRRRPDIRKEFFLGWGAILAGICLFSWIDSSLIAYMAESMTPTEAANLGGLVAGSAGLAVGVILGWIGGGWLIGCRGQTHLALGEAEQSAALSRLHHWFDSYPASRGLLLGGVASAVGAALGYWALLGGLMMIVAISLGYWGRANAERAVIQARFHTHC